MLKDLAGETVTIYQTEKDGSLAFFVVPKLDNLDKFIEKRGQEDQEPQNALIDQRNKKRCARGDSNARPSPCKGDVIIDRVITKI